MMKRHFKSIWKAAPAVVFSGLFLLSVAGFVFAQSPAQGVVPVLEGLDPVLLVQGKEVQGNLKITVTRGNFQYLFANEENKAVFVKDPARYEIQLDGACARMGAPVSGNPDLHTVYQGRIYIFGTDECKTRFEAAPESFLEGAGGAKPTAVVTPEAQKKGEALIEKAVAAMGGAEVIDRLADYQEKSTALQTRHQGDVEVKTNLSILFPDRVRLDQFMPDWSNPSAIRQAAMVISANEAFVLTPGGPRSLAAAQRLDQEREISRRPLSILRGRKHAGFNPAAIGTAKVGETAIELVSVEIDGTSYTLGIDPVTGRMLSLSYRRRGPGGEFGQFAKVFSDFRSVAGITLPFKITASFNDQPWKEQSATVESIAVNGKIDPALFEKPKTAKVQ